MSQRQKVNAYINASFYKFILFLPTGTWVTFGGQISDEVGARPPFALTLDRHRG